MVQFFIAFKKSKDGRIETWGANPDLTYDDHLRIKILGVSSNQDTDPNRRMIQYIISGIFESKKYLFREVYYGISWNRSSFK